MCRPLALAMLVVVLPLGLAACGSPGPVQTVAVQVSPTDRPSVKTALALATQIAKPTATVVVTATPKLTATARATGTPEPTATDAATPTAKPTSTPEAVDVVIGAQGFGQKDTQVGVGFFLENPNQAAAVDNVEFQLAAYDDAGNVLKTDQGTIAALFPGEKLGVASQMYLTEGQKAAKVDIQVHQGEPTPMEALGSPIFETTNAKYVADKYFPKVTGTIQSHLKKDVEQIFVYAIGYDDAGTIIGGGFTFLKFIPANGQSAVEVGITAAGVPAKVELYGALSNLSIGALTK